MVCILVMVLLCKSGIYKGLCINFVIFLFFKCYREETKEVCCESCMDCTFWKKVLKPKMGDLYILLNIYLNINLYLFFCFGLYLFL